MGKDILILDRIQNGVIIASLSFEVNSPLPKGMVWRIPTYTKDEFSKWATHLYFITQIEDKIGDFVIE